MRCKTCNRKSSSKYESCSYCYSKNQKLKVLRNVWENLPNQNKLGFEVQ
jgi:hypothetical protein